MSLRGASYERDASVRSDKRTSSRKNYSIAILPGRKREVGDAEMNIGEGMETEGTGIE